MSVFAMRHGGITARQYVGIAYTRLDTGNYDNGGTSKNHPFPKPALEPVSTTE